MVGEDQDFERTIAFGERALGYLKYNVTPAIPRYYELWYTYAAGHNMALINAVRELLAAKSRLTPEETERLYDIFLSPLRKTEQVEEVGAQISAELKDIVDLVRELSSNSGKYGESLEDAVAELDTVTSANQLKPIVTSLIGSTKEMVEHNRNLESRLEESREQITELNRSLEVIRTESMTDQLTSIANRKRFDQVINHEMNEAVENKTPLCLLLADIDHFKNFNDTYGHQTGDQVLRLVAHTLKTNVKGRDLAARYGGEEFAIVLPQTSLENALKLAEQIRRAVYTKELVKKTTGESLGRITISIGVAVYRPDEAVDAFIHRADTCLYAAKDAGRNTVKCETDADAEIKDFGPNAA